MKFFTWWRKYLLTIYVLIAFHVIKDILQDLLELDFLYFLDINEYLSALPYFIAWLVVILNILATLAALALVIIIPIIWIKAKKKPGKMFVLDKIAMVFTAIIIFTFCLIDPLLDPRIFNPKLFFDKSTRKSASQAKREYIQILQQGPFPKAIDEK